MELLNPCDDTVFPAQSVSFSGTAGVSNNWNLGPDAVMVWSDQPCYIAIGSGVTATTASTPIPSYTPIPIKVPNTSNPFRVSAIQMSTSGTLYCKPMNRA